MKAGSSGNPPGGIEAELSRPSTDSPNIHHDLAADFERRLREQIPDVCVQKCPDEWFERPGEGPSIGVHDTPASNLCRIGTRPLGRRCRLIIRLTRHPSSSKLAEFRVFAQQTVERWKPWFYDEVRVRIEVAGGVLISCDDPTSAGRSQVSDFHWEQTAQEKTFLKRWAAGTSVVSVHGEGFKTAESTVLGSLRDRKFALNAEPFVVEWAVDEQTPDRLRISRQSADAPLLIATDPRQSVGVCMINGTPAVFRPHGRPGILRISLPDKLRNSESFELRVCSSRGKPRRCWINPVVFRAANRVRGTDGIVDYRAEGTRRITAGTLKTLADGCFGLTRIQQPFSFSTSAKRSSPVHRDELIATLRQSFLSLTKVDVRTVPFAGKRCERNVPADAAGHLPRVFHIGFRILPGRERIIDQMVSAIELLCVRAFPHHHIRAFPEKS